jgi:DNA-binding IclR family transcriptional regulator
MRQYLDPNVILDRYKEGSETIEEVCGALGLLRVTVQAHTARLVSAGYLQCQTARGQARRYSVPDPLAVVPASAALRAEAINHARLPSALRELLRKADDGLSVEDMAEAAGVRQARVYPALQRMADAYIDRWEKPGRQFIAVWAVVVPPENCPRPDLIHKPRT